MTILYLADLHNPTRACKTFSHQPSLAFSCQYPKLLPTDRTSANQEVNITAFGKKKKKIPYQFTSLLLKEVLSFHLDGNKTHRPF